MNIYLNLKANLLESNLNSYYKDTNVKYRVMGVINIWGNYDDVKAVAQVRGRRESMEQVILELVDKYTKGLNDGK